MENRRQLHHIETLRALAALMVATYHFSAYFSWSNTTTNSLKFGAQGVEIFYMISGFIITYSLFHSSYNIPNYFKYMGKRLIRLMPPYILTIIIIHIVGTFVAHFEWGSIYDVNFRQSIINILFLADAFPQYDWINPIFATLEVELQFYFLIGLLFPLFQMNKWTFTIISFIWLFVGWQTVEADTALINGPYFICGIAAFYIKQNGWKLPYILPIIASLGTTFWLYYPEDFAIIIVGLIALLFLPEKLKLLNFTGKISFSLYLIHGIIGGWILYFHASSDFAQHYPIIMIVFVLALSWIGAFIMYQFVEKPYMKISKLIKYKK
ncbi:acyltransferase [Paracrocinitomix mangrovi]|uniref:acyltransferase family protein n=1 Tax=Paracrocinitomix mangrovi TaxID=2862509 RepID=UPI001C8E1C24|nr:acyltransferase [Paracrocinitomix mangrovi]UKN01753.1 acyltransferase [Paracrocinitomix mangrovi]